MSVVQLLLRGREEDREEVRTRYHDRDMFRDEDVERYCRTSCLSRLNPIYRDLMRRRRRSPPRVPPTVPCNASQCGHVVVYGHHYNCLQWDDYRREDWEYRDQVYRDDSLYISS